MTNDAPNYFEQLMAIARQSRVAVKFISRETAPGIDWDGLYLITRELGAGIAIRSDLEPSWRDWVLAHELGHHYGQLNGTLFSPFLRAHKVDSVDRTRWNKAAKLHPDEQMANCWAIRTLVTDAAWDEAERQSPTNLCDITGHLRLPLPAGIAWERLHRGHVQSHPITVPLDSDAREIFSRPVTGQGGHQSFFGRLRLRGGSLALTYDDFSYARERAAVVKGGWLARYQTVLAAVAPMLEGAGTTRALFKMRPDSDADSSN